ncbi:hypothetical protein [Tepidiforma sp.]|jgi:hypothetical protein|uniref:SH3 domain-containing protein n=1 Tax=Tepidiforma sp. TaxID=2682230 RepID=UPI0026194A03|nr:hypothetical protein [Tepidiforma sp.]MCX7616796.1 hypothetical protein [Tepidiforma sp.]
MGAALRSLAVGGLLGALVLAVTLDRRPAHADHYPCHVPNYGFGFDTYEYEDYVGVYNEMIDLVSAGVAVPPPYQLPSGEWIDLSYPGLETGPRGARQPRDRSATVPPSLYKAMVWIESGWAHAAGSVPYGGVGPVITAIDCGYGLGQITTGMGHLASPPALDIRVPSARQAIIGTHPLFNLAEGIRIFADKWNSAPELRPVAGTGDPAALEDWYYAVWSYNGFAFVNHPQDPRKNPLRGETWHCNDPNAPGFGSFGWGDYTYQEKVYGCLRYPPVPKGQSYPPPLSGGSPNQPPASSGLAVGDTAVVRVDGQCLNVRPTPGGNPPITCLPEGTLVTIIGGPQEVNGVTWWQVSAGQVSGWSAGQYLVKVQQPAPDAPVNPAGRMWPPQVVTMPSLAVPAVAAAFAPAAYDACARTAAECAAMDFPTTVPELGITTHRDTAAPVSASRAAAYLGAPQLQVIGERAVTLQVTASSSTAASITVRNTGSGIGPFRVRTSAAWLIVRHPSDPPGRVVDGGVAIGKDLPVVVSTSPRATQAGADSVLEIRIDPSTLPPNATSGTVLIEPLLGNLQPVTITVTVQRSGSASGPPQFPFKRILPNVTAEGSP